MLTECLLVNGLWRHWRCTCCVDSTAAYRTVGGCRSRFKRPSKVCSLVRSLKRKDKKRDETRANLIWVEKPNTTISSVFKETYLHGKHIMFRRRSRLSHVIQVDLSRGSLPKVMATSLGNPRWKFLVRDKRVFFFFFFLRIPYEAIDEEKVKSSRWEHLGVSITFLYFTEKSSKTASGKKKRRKHRRQTGKQWK